MNNPKPLDVYRFRFEEIKTKNRFTDDEWYETIHQYYPQLVEWLISDLEEFTKREQELFDVENHILWVDYRDYKFKVWLDAERYTLKGDILLNDEIAIVGLESDSLTHLTTELERAVDNQISYSYQSQLAQEIIKLKEEIAQLKTKTIEVNKKHSETQTLKVIASVYWWTKEPEDEFIGEEDITKKLDEELLESLGLLYGSNLLTTINQIDYVSELINSKIDVEEYDYFFEYHGRISNE